MWVATQVAARLSLQPHLFSLSSRYRGVPDAGHGQGQLDQMLRALHPAAQRPLKSADPAVRALRRAIDRGHDAKKGPNWTAQPAPPRPPPLRRRQDREAVAITATVPAAWRNSSCPRCPPARLLRPNASRGESKKAVARDKARSIPWDHLKEDLLVWCATRQPFHTFKPAGQGLNTARQTPTAPGATQSGARTLHIASGQEICRRYNFGNCARADCKFAHKCCNLPSAAQHSHIITMELAKEVEAGRVLGPFATPPMTTFRSSGLGAIPKKNGMILHLSAPCGSSVNDGIDKDEFPVQYSTVDDAVELISRGTALDSRQQLPGGCCPHYLDDFLVVGAPRTDQCSSAVQQTLRACESLGIPVAFDKLEGPSTRITFLGIMLDTEARVLSLPPGKLEEIQSKVHSWLGRRSATKRCHAGRLFLRRLIILSTTVVRLHHHIHLSEEARTDLDWWARFLPTWNGRAMFLEPQWSEADSLNLFTDASGTHGFRAFFEGSWIKGQWLPPQRLPHRSIQWQELFSILAATSTWHKRLKGRRVIFHCDNLAVVHAWTGQSSRDPSLMVLFRRSPPISGAPELGNILEAQLKRLIARSLAPTTAATYRVGIQRYLAFCSNFHVQPVPASKRLVAAFATHLWSTVTLPTIKVYLAAVSFLHHSEGLRSVVRGNQILRLLLREIRRSNLASPPRSCCRHPITPGILAKLLSSSQAIRSLQSQDKCMFEAAATLAFFGFLRIGEFTATPYHPASLSKGDIQLAKHELQIRLGRSKTDQWGKGAFVKIGCSRDSVCPVRAMER
eukprot:Em0018g8a